MHGTIQRPALVATNGAIRSDSEKTITRQTESEDHKWFTEPARDLLGSDPGLALHVLTGISPASGYRYANGHRGVTGWVMLQLIRSNHGRQWTAAFCNGVPWWTEMQREADLGRKMLALMREG